MQAMNKDALRRHFRTRRQEMPSAERELANARLMERMLALPELRAASTLLVYLSCKGEVDTWPVLRHGWTIGQTILAPRCRPDTQGEMDIHLVRAEDDLAPGRFGIPEPRPESAPIYPDPRPDVALVPALAFDRHGTRLGFGGGYYDRFLSALSPRPLLIGLAYDFQVVPSLPAEPWDIPVHMILTPATQIFCGEIA